MQSPDDAQGIFETLSIFENLIEINAEFADTLFVRRPPNRWPRLTWHARAHTQERAGGLLGWLTKRALCGSDDERALSALQRNRLQATELLSVWLQQADAHFEQMLSPATMEASGACCVRCVAPASP